MYFIFYRYWRSYWFTHIYWSWKCHTDVFRVKIRQKNNILHQKTMQDNSKEIKTRRKETNHVKTHQKLSVSRHKLYLLCCNTPWLIKKTKLSLAPIQETHFIMVWYKFWRKLLFSILIIALVILKYCCSDSTKFEGMFRENAAVSKYLGLTSTHNYKHLINQ